MKVLETMPEQLKTKLVEEHHDKGDYILIQGDTNEYLYFIIEGSVQVHTISKDGKEVALNSFTVNESFGALELFNDALKTHTVVAETKTIIKKLRKDYVLEWMKNDFEFTLYIITLLNGYFNQASTMVRNLISLNLKERVILSLSNHFKNQTIDSLTKSKLIGETGTQKRSLNRILEDLQKDGIIQYQSKTFTILKPELLLNLANRIE